MNDYFSIANQQHREAVAAVRAFRKSLTVVKKVEPKRESVPPGDGVVYTRVSSKPSLPEVFRRIEKAKVDEGMTADEIRDALYPTRSDR